MESTRFEIEADVAVVGAGLAGLVAATRAAGQGADVVVLEARGRVGGRLLNVELSGEPNDLGGQWIAPYQSRAHHLLGELGLELFPSFREGEHVYVGPDGEARRYAGHDAPLGDRAEADYARAAAALDSLAAELDPEAPWAHPEAADLDGITFEHWLRRTMPDGLGRDLLRSYLAGGYLTKPADSFSLLQGLATIAGAGSVDNLFEPDLCLNSRVVGGAAALPLRLAERLGERVVTGAPVRTCRWSEDGVHLVAEGGEVRARRAIVAVPLNLNGAIRYEPVLPAWRLRLEQSVSQGDVIKVLASYPEPFWRANGLSGQGFAPYQLVRELYDNSPPGGTPGVLVTFLAGENAERGRALPAAERRSTVLDGFACFVGPPAREPAEYVELDWSAEEWTRGAYCATFAVGGLSRHGVDLRRPIGPIYWAGTEIAGVGHMHMEGAIRTGETAAAAVLESL